MHRFMKTTAVVFAGALLLSGCAASGGSDATDAAAGDSCETVRVEVRGISNGAQNTLATATDAAATVAYLEGLEERVDALAEEAGDDTALGEALDALNDKLDGAIEYAETIQADAEQDAEALAAQQSGIQDAAVKVTEVCAAK